MQASDDPLVLARHAFLRACSLDVATPKPGNVSIDRAGHRMDAEQFIASASACVTALFAHRTPVGARILDAVMSTQQAVGCNTNLGIVLLVAPLAAALEEPGSLRSAAHWRDANERVLAHLSVDDAKATYLAIRAANPGGLGDASEQSVHAQPTINLRAAMKLAAARDSIARQYENGFADIFTTGLDAIAALLQANPDATPETLTLDVFLTFLSAWPDSHIVRKQGVTVAQSVTREAARRHAQWRLSPQGPQAARLDAWDAELKREGINPGTSADLTVATLFVAICLAPQRFLRSAAGS
ncbi:triphosphoribosyl-dephospho-CoA synthase [Paraburkholderia humisilvae]|uniref:2-(5''-triphosphoribosyl)-3'-dephosphocoenzyme-A synthase n=1 Tax=Paraburkholderia humisilvae TaxID=627669 RepID=A0A6J5D3T4_9BURK|nr:triphosphoribosyl-dephospho-CoA synthase [Paraburkholderia humisilvae]CAB3748950.1 2-(5''-triphosphoribosyl)-3'-dephosphocoenzyme-A synthase [Paraburkholderia humisilvae]